MTTYRTIPLMAVSLKDGGPWEPGRPLVAEPQLGSFFVTSDGPEGAAEVLFGIGNRMGADDDGRIWPSSVRSLSVGDVVVVVARDSNKRQAVLTVNPVGWGIVEEADLFGVLTVGTVAPTAKAWKRAVKEKEIGL